MTNSLNNEIYTFFCCIGLGVLCGVIFDIFKVWRYGRTVGRLSIITQDAIYFAIITVAAFNIIFHANDAQLRLYMPVTVLSAFWLYRISLSKVIVPALVKVRTFLAKTIKLLFKIIFFPIIKLVKMLILPFLSIKRKLLRKKVKIALTFNKICFKIKCNVGMMLRCKKDCKERKSCRKKRKPEKRV